mmetsp:Transcript_6328/g.13229  ORF Transcript_6328/g.13229 Transcript_6328/m.13229 type:complete len:484 (+) Transcript_6328:179-1630(+)
MPPRSVDPFSTLDEQVGNHGRRSDLAVDDPSGATSTATCRSPPDGTEDSTCRKSRVSVSPTTTLCILVMLDMLAVSLVVPLLHQYYKTAGISSARQRELLSSLFSSSQIAGGLMLGALSDVGVLSRRSILFVSFLGSAVSYALIVWGGVTKLIISRVLVGLVKQTMTISTSLLARYTTTENRSVHMGRLTASTTMAWIVGPSCGALLYKHVDTRAPALVACGIFLLNSAIAAFFLPGDGNITTKMSSSKSKGRFSSFFANLKACFSSTTLASVVIALVLFGWVKRTTSYANMASFYEEKYGIEPHQRGYLSSYQQILNFVVQYFFVRALLSAAGGERRAACMAAAIFAAATLVEVWASFTVFACFVCPLVAMSLGILGLSLRSLVTQVSPKESLSSVLAALDVLQNVASVTVPFYRTILFTVAARIGNEDKNASMRGDPDPRLWLLSSFVHWTAFAAALGCLLILPTALRRRAKQNKQEKKNR